MTSDFRIDGDRHLEDPADDRIGFQSMARRISQVLTSEQSDTGIVIGLVGSWGSGKTTLMKFASRELEKSGAVTVWFNPWYYKGADALIGSFFHELAAQLGEKLKDKASDKLKKAVQQYSGLFGIIPIVGGAAAAQAEKLRTESSIEELKSAIETILAESGKRIVVFLDDIDRLDEDEVWDTLRLVKLCGGFRQLSFVLAYDRRYVEAIIKERYTQLSDPASYLEKIVQLPIQMPEVPRASLERLLVEELREVVERARSMVADTYTDEDGERLWIGLGALLRFEIATVRDAKRFGNSVRAMFDLTAGEVNATDFILVEALRVHFPKIAEALRDQRLDMIEGAALTQPDGRPLPLDRASEIVRVLFPKAIDGNARDALEKHKRVCHPRYVDRYFFRGIPTGEVADAVIRDALLALGKDDSKPLLDACREGPESALRGLKVLSKELDLDTAERLLVFLTKEADVLTLSADPNETLSATAAETLANLLTKFERQNASRLVAEIVKITAIHVAEELLMQLVDADFLDFGPAADVLLKRYSSSPDKPLHDPRSVKVLWHVIAKVKTRDDFTAWLKRHLDRTGLEVLLGTLTFRGFTVGEYDELTERADPEVIVAAIREHVGETGFSEYWIQEQRDLTMEELCGSFLKRHGDESGKSRGVRKDT